MSPGADTHLCQVELTHYLAGLINDNQRCEMIEAHLGRCEQCRRAAQQLEPEPFEIMIKEAAGPPEDHPRLGARYETLQEIGRGSGGIVYLARQPGLQRPVALKMLLSGVSATGTERARFHREAAALARLNHRHIVQVYDAGEQDNVPFIAMQWLRGPTLAQALRHGLPRPIVAAKIVADLADAVALVHRHGMLHRDLKPQNILLVDPDASSDDECQNALVDSAEVPTEVLDGLTVEEAEALFQRDAKITDFGLTLLVDDTMQTQAGMPLGTPAYMAPEAARGDRRELGPPTDIYGMGAILYECLTGRPPFLGGSTAEILRAVTDQEVVSIQTVRPDVPRDLGTICQRCLAKHPRQRFLSAEELRDDLLRFIRHEPILSRPQGPIAKGVKWLRRHPWPAAALAIILVGVALAIGGLFMHQRELLRQQKIAWGKYDDARQAIWEMLDLAEEQSVFDIPELRKLTLGQAERALKLFTELAEEAPTLQAQRELALVRLRVGTLLAAAGEMPKAEQQFKLAWQQLTSLTDDSDSDRQAMYDAIAAQIKLAVSLRNQQRNDEAIAMLKSAEPRAVAMLEQQPIDVPGLNQLAWLRHNLATALFDQRNHEAAITAYEQAIELRRRAMMIEPDNDALQLALSESQTCLAVCLMATGQIVEAEERYRQVIGELESILERNPQYPGAIISLALTHLNLSNISAGNGDIDDAIGCCSRGIEYAEKVLQADPNDHSARAYASMLYGNRAQFRMQNDELADALTDWKTGADLAPVAETRHYCQAYAGRTLIEMGGLDQAAEELRGIDPVDWSSQDHFLLVSTWGLLLHHLDQADSSSVDTTSMAEEARRQVLDGMSALKASGFLAGNQSAREHVEQTADFRVIRESLTDQQLSSWFDG